MLLTACITARTDALAADKSLDSDGAKTQSSASTAMLTITSAMASGTTLYSVDIVNSGSEPVDVSALSLADGAGSRCLGSGWTLVRGSFLLQPGDKALIVTHADVPTDDDARSTYDNLYTTLAAGSGSITVGQGGLVLLNPAGRKMGPVSAAPDVTGRCCRPTTSETGVCLHPFPVQCNGFYPMCSSPVTKNYCCTTLFGCCWKEGDTFCAGGGSYCTGGEESCP